MDADRPVQCHAESAVGIEPASGRILQKIRTALFQMPENGGQKPDAREAGLRRFQGSGAIPEFRREDLTPDIDPDPENHSRHAVFFKQHFRQNAACLFTVRPENQVIGPFQPDIKTGFRTQRLGRTQAGKQRDQRQALGRQIRTQQQRKPQASPGIRQPAVAAPAAPGRLGLRDVQRTRRIAGSRTASGRQIG